MRFERLTVGAGADGTGKLEEGHVTEQDVVITEAQRGCANFEKD
jgi:hypothetical protein